MFKLDPYLSFCFPFVLLTNTGNRSKLCCFLHVIYRKIIGTIQVKSPQVEDAKKKLHHDLKKIWLFILVIFSFTFFSHE